MVKADDSLLISIGFDAIEPKATTESEDNFPSKEKFLYEFERMRSRIRVLEKKVEKLHEEIEETRYKAECEAHDIRTAIYGCDPHNL